MPRPRSVLTEVGSVTIDVIVFCLSRPAPLSEPQGPAVAFSPINGPLNPAPGEGCAGRERGRLFSELTEGQGFKFLARSNESLRPELGYRAFERADAMK